MLDSSKVSIDRSGLVASLRLEFNPLVTLLHALCLVLLKEPTIEGSERIGPENGYELIDKRFLRAGLEKLDSDIRGALLYTNDSI